MELKSSKLFLTKSMLVLNRGFSAVRGFKVIASVPTAAAHVIGRIVHQFERENATNRLELELQEHGLARIQYSSRNSH